jgi:hypothetical protein
MYTEQERDDEEKSEGRKEKKETAKRLTHRTLVM